MLPICPGSGHKTGYSHSFFDLSVVSKRWNQNSLYLFSSLGILSPFKVLNGTVLANTILNKQKILQLRKNLTEILAGETPVDSPLRSEETSALPLTKKTRLTRGMFDALKRCAFVQYGTGTGIYVKTCLSFEIHVLYFILVT